MNMSRERRSLIRLIYRLRYIAIIIGIALAVILLTPGVFKGLLASDEFMPHGHCYLWKPGLVWLHVASDFFIGVAYVAISLTLVYFVRKKQNLPFSWMFLAFGVFIVACGATHFMEVLSLPRFGGQFLT
jgi:hypothetical protein